MQQRLCVVSQNWVSEDSWPFLVFSRLAQLTPLGDTLRDDALEHALGGTLWDDAAAGRALDALTAQERRGPRGRVAPVCDLRRRHNSVCIHLRCATGAGPHTG